MGREPSVDALLEAYMAELDGFFLEDGEPENGEMSGGLRHFHLDALEDEADDKEPETDRDFARIFEEDWGMLRPASTEEEFGQ